MVPGPSTSAVVDEPAGMSAAPNDAVDAVDAAQAADAAERQGRLLLALARQAIAAALGVAAPAGAELDAAAREPWLRQPGACFVTLTNANRLRGCIGSVRPRRPLIEDLRSNARAAALADPRFPPLSAAELPQARVEVSLLSPLAPLAAASEAEALAALRPGIDGLVLDYAGDAQATFLPQVWDSLRTPREFLSQLKLKAGLPAELWSPAIRLQRYTVVKWQE
jgi:AmmeMemoRadiSam system protein A